VPPLPRKAPMISFLFLFLSALPTQAKEIAFTFDDAPAAYTLHFESGDRTKKLIQKMKELKLPPAIIFANPCKEGANGKPIQQLEQYVKAGHLVANHTCTHPRLDDAGFEEYIRDTAQADTLLAPLMLGPKFFRYPFLNEGSEEKLRDSVRDWLQKNQYRHGAVSIDNDDYLFAFKLNKAKELKKKIDYEKVKALYLKHILAAAEFYDNLAREKLGRSPKHVLLLHEVDSSVLYLEDLVAEFKRRGWKIISAAEAFEDKIYAEAPKSLYANNGIIAQLVHEKTGEKARFGDFEKLTTDLDTILGL
jgi:peptidoglycan/xylan/chitin deacetylase (PgdA/CDA1 family)